MKRFKYRHQASNHKIKKNTYRQTDITRHEKREKGNVIKISLRRKHCTFRNIQKRECKRKDKQHKAFQKNKKRHQMKKEEKKKN